MPRQILPAQANVLSTDVLPLSQGGTGSSTVPGAVANLGAIPLSFLGKQNGVASLDTTGLIPMSQIPPAVINAASVLISGPVSLGIGLQGTYTINNYDSTRTYTVTAISGTVSISGATITYTAPLTTGQSGFTVNGVTTSVAIIDPANSPTVSGPTSLLENQSGSFTITNYDANSVYTVTASQGSVTQSGAIITYTAPAGDGINTITAGFTISGPSNSTPVNVTINPPPAPVVTGPSTVVIGLTATFTVTNYTPPATYNVSTTITTGTTTTTNGSATFNTSNGTIAYTAPTTTGNYTFTVNGTVVAVQVVPPQIQTPSITSPVDGSTNLGPFITFASSAFTMQGGTDTQRSASWQVSANGDNTFTQPLTASNMNSTSALTQWTPNYIPSNGTFYVRVQYNGNQGGVSAWSTPVGFSTKAQYVASTITARVSSNVANSYFGQSVSLNANGTIALISTTSENSSTGAVYVYQNVSGTWTQMARVTSGIAGSYFGNSVSLSDDGTIALIAAGSENTNTGAVYVYQNISGTWTQTSRMASGVANSHFGYRVSLSSNGTIALIGAPFENSVVGAVYIYQNVSGTWTQISTMSSGAANSAFGYSASLSADGTIALIGAYYENSGIGAAYIYQNVSGTWTQIARVAGSTATYSYFGSIVSLSSDGTVALIGAYGENSNTGAAYIYQNVSGTWTQIYRAASGIANSSFGSHVSLNADGSIALIGAYYENSGIGAAYIYQNVSGTWTQTSRMTSGVANAEFGYSTSLNSDGSIALISARGENSNTGAAYIAS